MSKYNSCWIDRNLLYDNVPESDGMPHYCQVDRPLIICLCGSTRFWKEFQEANYRETMAGKIVLSVGHYPNIGKQCMTVDGCMGLQEVIVDVVGEHGPNVGCTPEQKIALDNLYMRKIELADEVLILNLDGYIGSSTKRELEHAQKLGKTIRFLESEAV